MTDTRRRAAGRGTALWLLAALLLLALQSLIVQGHVHLRGATIAGAAGAGVHTSDGAQRQSGDDPATCPACRELAAAGHYIAPAPPAAIPGEGPESALLAGVLAAAAPRRRRARGWRSRGPPHGLPIH